MPYRRYLPTREKLREFRSLKFLGEMIFEPNLWHFNRHSVSFAFLVGIFCCFLPIPFQMVPCVLLCVWIRCNVPLSIALVWISNPVTMPPMFYSTYKLGTWMLGRESQVSRVNLSWEWLSAQFTVVWEPLLLGSLLTGITLGSLAFVIVRIYWRWRVARHWSMRRFRRRLAQSIHSEAHPPDEAAPPARQDIKLPPG
jgi:uncharacterized protein (DUF2062 family)